MSEVDNTIIAAAMYPLEAAARGAAADAVREACEPELGDALEAETGVALLQHALELSRAIGLPMGLRLLWCAHNVIPRLRPAAPRDTIMAANPGRLGDLVSRPNEPGYYDIQPLRYPPMSQIAPPPQSSGLQSGNPRWASQESPADAIVAGYRMALTPPALPGYWTEPPD